MCISKNTADCLKISLQFFIYSKVAFLPHKNPVAVITTVLWKCILNVLGRYCMMSKTPDNFCV